MRLARAALFLAIAIASAAADRIPTELFPPNTRMVVGLSLRALLDSPLLQAAGGAAPFVSNAPIGVIDPKDLDSVIIASEGGTSDAPSIAVVRGRFRLDRSKAALHDGIPVFEDRKGALALLDEDTAVAGSLADVKAAIDRRGNAPTLSADLAARAAVLSAGNDFWAVGDIPEGVKPKNPSAKGMDSIDRFDFGASLRNGLQLRGSIRLRSAEDAAKMAMAIQMFGSMLQPDPTKTGAKFNLQANGNTISLDLSIPEAELKKTVASQRTLLTGMLQGGMLQGGMPASFGGMPREPAMAAPRPAARPTAPLPPGTVARGPLSHTPAEPATVVTNDRGETVQLVLPGAK